MIHNHFDEHYFLQRLLGFDWDLLPTHYFRTPTDHLQMRWCLRGKELELSDEKFFALNVWASGTKRFTTSEVGRNLGIVERAHWFDLFKSNIEDHRLGYFSTNRYRGVVEQGIGSITYQDVCQILEEATEAAHA